MHNGDDNRLTDVFITQAMKPALDTVEKHWRANWKAGQAKKDESLTKGALILVGNRKQDKFFSNGTCSISLRKYDLPTQPSFTPLRRQALISRTLSRTPLSRPTSSHVSATIMAPCPPCPC